MKLTDEQIVEMRAHRGQWFLPERERAMLDALLDEFAALRVVERAARAFLAQADRDYDLDDPTVDSGTAADDLEDALAAL